MYHCLEKGVIKLGSPTRLWPGKISWGKLAGNKPGSVPTRKLINYSTKIAVLVWLHGHAGLRIGFGLEILSGRMAC